jgi:saccharopepsin
MPLNVVCAHNRLLIPEPSVGPVDLTNEDMASGKPVPTVVDNLFKDGTVSSPTLGIFFQPATTSDDSNSGELSFGSVDTSKITSKVAYVPITTTHPASLYWGIKQAITYGDSKLLPATVGIVDTGRFLSPFAIMCRPVIHSYL